MSAFGKSGHYKTVAATPELDSEQTLSESDQDQARNSLACAQIPQLIVAENAGSVAKAEEAPLNQIRLLGLRSNKLS